MGRIINDNSNETMESMLNDSTKDNYKELFYSESIRGEKIHWKINWIFYSVILIFCLITYQLQGNKVAGIAGVILALINLIYNIIVGIIIHRYKPLKVIGYITITLNVLSLTVYNYLDIINNSMFLTVTSATILLYPILIFLASLRLNRKLIIYSTLLCIIAMDGLYIYFYIFFNLDITTVGISTDWLSQIYRSIYILLIGYMIYTLPKTMHRILSKQEELRQEKFYHQIKAERDPLTSLFNRYYLESYFKTFKDMNDKEHFKYALLYIDLNDFKQINDTYGHDFGDFVLKSVAKDLQTAVSKDDVVIRLGGDELIILSKLKPESETTEELIQRVSEKIIRPRSFNDITLVVKSSIGAAIYPDDATTLDELLKKADREMYTIKKQKKHIEKKKNDNYCK